MSTHTLGPWTAIVEKDDECVVDTYVVDADEDVVVRPSAKLSEANAHLIAAAPDLLAALKQIIPFASGLSGHSYVLADARAAIAKAEGAS